MEALPIEEQTNNGVRIDNGAKHACRGHDLHTVALIGAAHLLSRHRDRVAGHVVFFQPREGGLGTAPQR
ncbi:hypothetical protein [Rhodococcus sp. LB1]|uniref:hypothetical protein n=1 Tax=Rhodococcus sp. LB1 TaxID=1807499 RepID=UPI003FA69D06